MSDELAELRIFVARLKASHDLLAARLERTFRFGKVVDDSDVDVSDATKPRARIQIGIDSDGNPVKGPMVPFATIAGARNQHSAPSKDQQFLMIAPDGNHEAGVLIALGHSNLFPSPSTNASEYVDGTNGLDKRFKASKHQIKAGDQTIHLITDQGQRIQVEDISKFVIKIGSTPYKLQMSALEPTNDLDDF